MKISNAMKTRDIKCESRLMTVISAIILAVSLTSCSRYNIPRGFPDPEEMAQILTDIHILESTITYIPELSSTIERNTAGQYRQVLQRHGITPADFDTIRNWYINNPELYQVVYEKVITNLSRREAEIRVLIEQEQLEQARLEKEGAREIDLWQGAGSITISANDTTDNRVPFKIPVDTLAPARTIIMSATYQFRADDNSRAPRMMLSATYKGGTADTVFKEIPHSFNPVRTSLEMELRVDSIPVTISGFLLYQDQTIDASVEITGITLRQTPLPGPGQEVNPGLVHQ